MNAVTVTIKLAPADFDAIREMIERFADDARESAKEGGLRRHDHLKDEARARDLLRKLG